MISEKVNLHEEYKKSGALPKTLSLTALFYQYPFLRFITSKLTLATSKVDYLFGANKWSDWKIMGLWQ